MARGVEHEAADGEARRVGDGDGAELIVARVDGARRVGRPAVPRQLPHRLQPAQRAPDGRRRQGSARGVDRQRVGLVDVGAETQRAAARRHRDGQPRQRASARRQLRRRAVNADRRRRARHGRGKRRAGEGARREHDGKVGGQREAAAGVAVTVVGNDVGLLALRRGDGFGPAPRLPRRPAAVLRRHAAAIVVGGARRLRLGQRRVRIAGVAARGAAGDVEAGLHGAPRARVAVRR